MKKIKLYCLPYAGGSGLMYNKWKVLFENQFELCPIELSGRGARIGEPLYSDIEEAIEDIYSIISDEITSSDYIFYGHSMGAYLVYELIQKITNLNVRQPLHAFFSGRKPPHIPRKFYYSTLSVDAFEKEVLSLGATPPELFSNPDLKEIFVPILRSDFNLSESIIERDTISKLPINITILVGKDEEISEKEAEEWKLHTSKNCQVVYIDGGHFFLFKEAKTIVKIIQDSILNIIVD